MISGLLLTINILVCIALVGIVLIQRSEGGVLGMGGNPGGLVTARGAGDLLTRITWGLFTVFLVISLTLTLLGAHNRATSNVLERLKLEQANPNAINQARLPAATNALAPPSAPVPQSQTALPPGFGAGVPSAPPISAPLPVAQAPLAPARAPTPKPAAPAVKVAHAAKAPAAASSTPTIEAPPPPAPAKSEAAPAPASTPATSGGSGATDSTGH